MKALSRHATTLLAALLRRHLCFFSRCCGWMLCLISTIIYHSTPESCVMMSLTHYRRAQPIRSRTSRSLSARQSLMLLNLFLPFSIFSLFRPSFLCSLFWFLHRVLLYSSISGSTKILQRLHKAFEEVPDLPPLFLGWLPFLEVTLLGVVLFLGMCTQSSSIGELDLTVLIFLMYCGNR